MIKPFDIGYMDKITDIFYDIYKNPPFCYKWVNKDNIYQYFSDMAAGCDFKGFVYEIGGNVIGACFGQIKEYFANSRYSINEIFIKRELQSRGYGTEFMGCIEDELRRISIEIIELTTQRDIHAYHFYKKNNFYESKKTVYMIKSLLS